MSEFLYALGVASYRGIPDEGLRLNELSKINLFVGANNSGKSTVLKVVEGAIPFRSRPNSIQPKRQVDPIDRHIGSTRNPILEIGYPVDFVLDSLVSAPRGRVPIGNQKDLLRDFLVRISDEHEIIWWSVDLTSGSKASLHVHKEGTLSHTFQPRDWNSIQVCLSQSSGGDVTSMMRNSLAGVDESFAAPTQHSFLIPAIREIGGSDGEFDLTDMNGRGLINRLAEIQNPALENYEDQEIFARINRFVQSVTGEADARIEIPNNRQYVLVHMNGRVLPLSSVGTGIHEVIMIASFCTLVQDSIVCLEEPEIHLHPILQRKLINYLSDNTQNQYFIATHSPSFIDTRGASVYRVFLQNDKTSIEESKLDSDRFNICLDLGYRASDLVQTNFIVWVEGPSDRIYLNHWISALAPELIEGVHYSIMFYGGRLLSHLTASETEVGDFIKLRALNRNMALVMDSDRSAADDGVGATKTRLQREFNSDGGMAWITKGREIENYIEPERIEAALRQIYSRRFLETSGTGPYDNVLHFFRNADLRKTAKPKAELFKGSDKVKVARFIASRPANLDVMALKRKVRQLVGLIKGANS